MAEPFTVFTSRVVPIPAENVDTDQIVPARYLKVTDKNGLAEALFRDWRFEEDGSLKEPPFVLDRPEMAGRKILLVGDNFGAGSSREHAPWALTAWGIRAILSTSFADIFRSNSLKNGVLPIVVDAATHARLFEILADDPDAQLTIDLAEQGVLLPDGSTLDFDIDPFAKRMILAGTDELGYLLSKDAELSAWEAAHPPRIDSLAGTRLAGFARRGHAGRGGRPADAERGHGGAQGAHGATQHRGREMLAVRLDGGPGEAEGMDGRVADRAVHREVLQVLDRAWRPVGSLSNRVGGRDRARYRQTDPVCIDACPVRPSPEVGARRRNPMTAALVWADMHSLPRRLGSRPRPSVSCSPR